MSRFSHDDLFEAYKQFFKQFLNNSNFNQLIIHKVSHKITNIKFHLEHTKGDVSSNFSSDLEKYK